MAVADKIRKLSNEVQSIEPGPGCVGFWVDSANRLKYKDDQGNVYTAFDPSEVIPTIPTITRLFGTFDESDTLSLTFEREVEVEVSLDGESITFAAGAITSADVGKQITWEDFVGTIDALLTSTSASILPVSGNAESGTRTATVGEDQPDTNYKISSIQGDGVLEIFGSGNKSVSGFDVYSSNVTSTAPVTVEVIR